MPNKNNIAMLEKVNESIANSKGFFVVDYRGLSVKESQEVRRALREVNSEMKVYKNNIVRIALKEEGLPDIGESLVGTCAYVFFEKDAVEAAKAIKAKMDSLKKISFIAGIADGQALEETDIVARSGTTHLETVTIAEVRIVLQGDVGILAIVVDDVQSFLELLHPILVTFATWMLAYVIF